MSAYVIPAIERAGLRCPCGEQEPMRPEEGSWLEWVGDTKTSGPPGYGHIISSRIYHRTSRRLLWYRCITCGSITRETLLPT